MIGHTIKVIIDGEEKWCALLGGRTHEEVNDFVTQNHPEAIILEIHDVY
jgi:hypothetical protein